MKEKVNTKAFKRISIFALSIVCIVCATLIKTTNGFANAQFISKFSPTITVDYQGFENPPNAILNKEYPIFKATAVDSFGESLPVEVAVFMYYYSETPASLSLVDGKFVPKIYGEYTVEYSATDMVGNTAISTYNFVCGEKTPLKAMLIDVQSQAFIGEGIELPQISFENNTGEVKYSVYALAKTKNKIKKVDNLNNFIPEYVGEYEIIYKYEDFLESGEIKFSLNVLENDLTSFGEDVSLPKYFILGCSYELPIPNVVTYVAGKPTKVFPEVLVGYGDELPTSVSYKDFIPNRVGDVSIIYRASINGKRTEKTYTGKVVDVDYDKGINTSKYFYSDYILTTANRNDVTITTATPDCLIDFITPVLSERMSFVFKVKNTENFFGSLDMYLTDSCDSNIKVKFSLVKNSAENSYLSINDGKGVKTSANFYDGKSINFSYSDSTCSASMGEMSSVLVKTDLNGDEFKGFPSGKVYLSFSFGDLYKQSSIIVSSVNGQTMTKAGDQISPQTIYNRNFDVKTIGDVVTISPVLVSDVLNPNFSVEYYVVDPEGNVVVDVDGLSLNANHTDYSRSYTFKLEKYGTYNVVICAKDSFGNEETYSYGITVADLQAPYIYFTDYLNKNYKVGDTVTIPKAIAKDNVSETCLISVYYMDGTGVVNKVNDGKIYLKYSGKYTIYYYATDEANNVSLREITFNVGR